ncbi:MAG: hypothetical protein ACYDIE_07760 [Candidatus Krumholzibacteriia bacterium]
MIHCLVLLVVGIVGWAAPARAVIVQADFDPGLLVMGNDLIVEGALLALGAGAPRPLIAEQREFLFPHDEGRILVRRVLRQRAPLDVAAGDTVTFHYPTDNKATSPTDSGISAAIYDLPRPPAVAVGDSGVFCLFRVPFDGSLTPVHEFLSRGDEAEAIEVILRAMAADSAGTVAALRARHPGMKFRN